MIYNVLSTRAILIQMKPKSAKLSQRGRCEITHSYNDTLYKQGFWLIE